jgi:hypothetical protein
LSEQTADCGQTDLVAFLHVHQHVADLLDIRVGPALERLSHRRLAVHVNHDLGNLLCRRDSPKMGSVGLLRNPALVTLNEAKGLLTLAELGARRFFAALRMTKRGLIQQPRVPIIGMIGGDGLGLRRWSRLVLPCATGFAGSLILQL